MQPDVTIEKLVNDVVLKLQEQTNTSKEKDNVDSTQPRAEHQVLGDLSNQTDQIVELEANPNTDEIPRNVVQVIPLHTPPQALVKFFFIHPSHRYAMSLVPLSTGFQFQVFNRKELESGSQTYLTLGPDSTENAIFNNFGSVLVSGKCPTHPSRVRVKGGVRLIVFIYGKGG